MTESPPSPRQGRQSPVPIRRGGKRAGLCQVSGEVGSEDQACLSSCRSRTRTRRKLTAAVRGGVPEGDLSTRKLQHDRYRPFLGDAHSYVPKERATSASRSSGGIVAGTANGKKIVTVVPLFPASVLLVIAIWPPRFLTSCFTTQSPIPVP
jgi:hypothetical protein